MSHSEELLCRAAETQWEAAREKMRPSSCLISA